ncbi:MAG TPA: hypothetical protein VN363_03520, partial [Anaerolineales bacterium]|nr:hypothetical protein [Anaerolineales bacterium]
YLVTETMMTIEVPRRRRLKLGEDLTGEFPAVLQQISSTELLALLAAIDPTPDSLVESGTNYWGDLADRIHFIADMFRCFESSVELQEPPFDPEQTVAIKENRLPEGRL